MDIKRLFRFRTYLPKGITGRFVAMSTIPLVLFLLASGYAFYRAHKTDSAAKAALFAGNIATLVDMYREVSDPVEYEDFKKLAMANFNMDVSFEPGAGIPRAKRIAHRLDLLSTRFIEKSLRAKLKYPFVIDADENSSFLGVRIRLPAGVLSANMSLRAVFSKAIYGFAAWIVSAAVLFALIMLPFLRGQIQSIKRLTAAIEKADRGEDISGVKFTGPRQIVDAGRDMIRAYSALKSHLEEKEAMLLGISHDLKTPLARMVLELEFASDKALA
ncbi:MAG: hypothetical protein LBH41_00980 [Rickettsiales bacterium]|jgi:two-component system osmolarity sensor histidine kinase EnvZ|nr:hypothetical protein [Rickettsiales bacterium]